MAGFSYSLKHGLDFHIQDKSIAPHLWPLYHQHLKNPNWNPDLPAIYVNDDKHTYTELPFEESWREKNIILGTPDINTGYFQSHLYLKGYEKEVLEGFRLNREPERGKCAIHVRRGDYIQLDTRHPVVTEKYLDQAFWIMIKEGVYDFTFFSDDISWCMDYCKKKWEDKKATPFINFSFGDETSDFKWMMHFQYQIVANSSFSVLPAILNPNADKLVVCPHEDNYMGPDNKHLSVENLYPENWIRIKY